MEGGALNASLGRGGGGMEKWGNHGQVLMLLLADCMI